MKEKKKFFCSDCGNETPVWYGQCRACGAWDTIVEAPAAAASAKGNKSASGMAIRTSTPTRLSELDTDDEIRFTTGIGELDRVLGGGAVRGSVVLFGGAPGIGKSTLLLQICGLLSGEKILYVSGEESQRQIKLRAQRLDVNRDDVYLLAETNLDNILETISSLEPDVVIIDSVQTIYNGEISSGAGSVSQVKDCTMQIMQNAKTIGFTCFIVGHVNKDGAIAGPKVLEHMVDCVLYFEGDKAMSYRILRAAKNRFGSTNEIGVFEMLNSGLREVPNPSEMLLAGRPMNSSGTCVTCVMEGTRPILAEVQALVTPSGYAGARKNVNGFDYNRAMLLLAVLEKRAGLKLSACDAYINVVGGLVLDEPAADLAAVLALASSARDKVIDPQTAAIGEIGLSGEVRSVNAINLRLSEVLRLGFNRCIIPSNMRDDILIPKGLEVVKIRNVREAVAAALKE